jgi:hypothetical protein
VIGAVVDWGQILDVVWTSASAGIGVTMVFAIAIHGATRVMDMSRDGRTLEAGLYGALAIVALAAVVAAVVLGIIVMTRK